MFKLFKYLSEFKTAILAIVLLLVLQAYCDLALPQYTSNIVDVGIQQGGIENAVPTQMRAATFDSLKLFMTDEDAVFAEQCYQLSADGIYELSEKNADAISQLDGIFSESMVVLSGMEESGQAAPADLTAMVEAGVVTKEQLLAAKEEALNEIGYLGDSMIKQRAILFVSGEYQAMGLDLGKIQNSYLFRTGGKMLGITVVMVITAVFAGLLAARTAAKVGMNLRGRIFNKVVAFSNSEINQFSTASLITRTTNDIQQVQMVSVMLLRIVIYSPILGIGGIIKVVNTRTGMGWIIAVAVGMIMLLVGILMVIAMPRFKKMQVLVDRLNLVSREILTGISVIRAFGREKYEEKRFDKANHNLMSTQLFTNRVMTFMMPAMMLIMNGITVLIVWNGAHGMELGNLQVGDMIAFITYTMQIVMSFLMLTMISVMLPRAGVAAGRIDEVLNTEPEIEDQEKVRDQELESCKGYLNFEDVSFRYPGADEDALSHITFQAKPGKTTAIIGSTGCGKSTLIHLIPRFYDVTEGRITLDGIDIREVSQKKLRSTLGFVPQRGVLFSGTIESNIKFGGDWITDENMAEAAQIAQAEDFISAKADGYQSNISQGGTNVSGGQKQRLSIARAIAKKPKVFLFDDSFSALDYKTDVVLRRALNEKIADAAVIIVAQRISTILHADQIIVLDDGKIVGIGTHSELLVRCKEYQEIAKSQLSEAELKGGLAE